MDRAAHELQGDCQRQHPGLPYSGRDIDYTTWYVDKLGDLRCDAIHHDGTNHLLYRTYKPGVRESQIDLLKEKLYYGTATRADVTRITRRLGDEIGKVYGWDFPSVGGRLCPWKGREHDGTITECQIEGTPLHVRPADGRSGGQRGQRRR